MSSKRRRKRARHKRDLARAQKHAAASLNSSTQTASRQTGFLLSLEKYFYVRLQSSTFKWEWVGIALVGLVIVSSIASGYFNSSTLFGTVDQVIKYAATRGDYTLAESLLINEQSRSSVLGAHSDLEEVVYPERKVENAILIHARLLEKYPGSRDVLVNLSRLYALTGKLETSRMYWDMARVLDPNNPIFSE